MNTTTIISQDTSYMINQNIPAGQVSKLIGQIKDTRLFLNTIADIDWNLEEKDHTINHKDVRTLLNRHTSGTQELIKTVISQTVHITWNQFTTELDKCIDTLLSKYSKFNIYYNTVDKVGSEHWLLALVWNRIKESVVELVPGLGDATNDLPIVLIDDCMYSGTNVAGLVDQFTYDNGYSYDHNPYVVLLPFSTKNARDLISNILHGLKHEHIYTVTIPQHMLEEVNMDLSTSIYAPVYFDHKIAGTSSSVPSVYNHVVRNGGDRSMVYKMAEMMQRWIDVNESPSRMSADSEESRP